MHVATHFHPRQHSRQTIVRGSTSPSCYFTHCVQLDFTAWLADDYPPYLPLDLGPPVVLTLEDSRHYSLNETSTDFEWESLYPGKDLGFIRLGPQKRFFGLSMYHQLHCLDSLRRAILGGTHGHGRTSQTFKRDVEHSSHCLNYLRQTVLCAADLTLEEELAAGTQDVGEGLSAIHVCRDWSRVQKFAQANWEEWEEWKTQRS